MTDAIPGTTPATMSPSIALELDMVMTVLNGHHLASTVPPELAEVILPLAEEWQATWGGLLAEPGRQLDLLELSAGLAGVLLSEDYSQVTLAIRELTPEAALARLAEPAGACMDPFVAPAITKNAIPLPATSEADGRTDRHPSVAPPPDARPATRLIAAVAGRQAALFAGLGFPAAAVDQHARHTERQMSSVVRILAGGDLHARFWHWLDRYYYQHYEPWRRTREPLLAQAVGRVRQALGSPAAESLPALSWLPAQNPLLRLPELRFAYEARRLQLVLWVEPFGLADSFSVFCPPGHRGPPLLVVACAEAGPMYANFRATAEDVAARAAALADPTRLIILRLIRHFGMVNTEIAAYLGLARPTVSVHARILRDAGLIQSRQEGRLVRHEIDPAEVHRLFRDLERFLDLPEDPNP
jgi:ArsR family transcriptional regulator, arsenate/arsenite/antimonite-responsive transcriptional repressor